MTKTLQSYLSIGDHGPAIDRTLSADMALAQIGWIGASGTVYPLGSGPSRAQEPGSFAPLYIQIGIWEDFGGGKYGISD